MKPLPKTGRAWLEEIREAFADASGALPGLRLMGSKIDAASLYTIAPNLCAKFRDLPASGAEFNEAVEMASASYAGSLEYQREAFKVPIIAFAFCYVTSHLGYRFIDSDETEKILDYLIENGEKLLEPMKPKTAKRRSPRIVRKKSDDK